MFSVFVFLNDLNYSYFILFYFTLKLLVKKTKKNKNGTLTQSRDVPPGPVHGEHTAINTFRRKRNVLF